MLCKIIKIVEIVEFLVLISYCLSLVECGRIKRVVGGSEVECGTRPRVASLRNATSSQHLCGATVLTSEYASTAAHCVSAGIEYFLQLDNYCGDPPRTRVLEVTTHPLYNRYSRAHDIALLRVEPIDFPEFTADILPPSSFGATGDCTVYGYGIKNLTTKELSETLLAASVRIVSLDECTELLGPYVAPEWSSGMMCAIGNEVDTCEGDSGGPLMCAGLLEGLSSHGLDCGVPGMPAMYTSIRAHLTWIQQLIQRR